MIEIRGIGASRGVAIGKVLLIEDGDFSLQRETQLSLAEEVTRLNKAKDKAIRQLEELESYALSNVGEDEAAIFEVHQMMIMDGELTERAEEIIGDEGATAEYAINQACQEFVKIFRGMDDPYMQERGKDIEDIGKRIVGILTGEQDYDLSKLDEPVIIVSKDLLPSDTVQLDKENILGIITALGSKMSHSSIIARSMQIPAVVGVSDILDKLTNGDEVVVDGSSGEIIIHPKEDIKAIWVEKQDKYKGMLEGLNQLKGTRSITKSGVEVKVNANIGSPGDMDMVIENDAEGIGLFRSEFLYMHSDKMPDEETQFKAYKEVLEKMGDKPVIIRTIDVGGDKEIDYLKIPKEENPFLGYRGIRICLDQIDLFKTQLRALIRAGQYGNLGIMFPMVCTSNELLEIQRIVKEVKEELRAEGVAIDREIQLGIMIETPAAVMISDELAKHVDFFSIGTNDLTQYTMAVDRMNPKVENLYDVHNPAVKRMIEISAKNAKKEGIWVGVCGEAAADTSLTEFFVDIGVDELSVNPGTVLEVRQKIQSI
ncbi:MAG: phosphoenolpyruvate--protein phosphotransferase [Epulopiscium sp.]|nr:phosphoenolpyruvate--protein phosphotransferase [Candidatus Epulonipiscium sp.]